MLKSIRNNVKDCHLLQDNLNISNKAEKNREKKMLSNNCIYKLLLSCLSYNFVYKRKNLCQQFGANLKDFRLSFHYSIYKTKEGNLFHIS